jgi:hypothetical protein
MRGRIWLGTMAMASVLLACGGSPTQAPAATQPGGGGGGGAATDSPVDMPTEAPPATQAGGGGGGGGGSTGGGTGRIRMEIGGPVSATVDEPFFAIGSRFGGQAGVQLNFTVDGSGGLAGITGIEDQWTITWLSEEFTANAVECTLTDWNFGESSASGKFDCKNGFATTPDNSYMTGVTMKGSFEAAQ